MLSIDSRSSMLYDAGLEDLRLVAIYAADGQGASGDRTGGHTGWSRSGRVFSLNQVSCTQVKGRTDKHESMKLLYEVKVDCVGSEER